MKTNEQPSDAAMQCALELLGIFGYPRDSYVEATVGRCVDRAIAAAVASATRELRGELRQVGQALREADAMICHIDRTIYPGWSNLSRIDIKRGMEIVEKNSAPATSACPDAR